MGAKSAADGLNNPATWHHINAFTLERNHMCVKLATNGLNHSEVLSIINSPTLERNHMRAIYKIRMDLISVTNDLEHPAI